jgi:hypothetical protein
VEACHATGTPMFALAGGDEQQRENGSHLFVAQPIDAFLVLTQLRDGFLCKLGNAP